MNHFGNNLQLYPLNHFLKYAKKKYHLNRTQLAGFKELMQNENKRYTTNPRSYIKPLKRYLKK